MMTLGTESTKENVAGTLPEKVLLIYFTFCTVFLGKGRGIYFFLEGWVRFEGWFIL